MLSADRRGQGELRSLRRGEAPSRGRGEEGRFRSTAPPAGSESMRRREGASGALGAVGAAGGARAEKSQRGFGSGQRRGSVGAGAATPGDGSEPAAGVLPTASNSAAEGRGGSRSAKGAGVG